MKITISSAVDAVLPMYPRTGSSQANWLELVVFSQTIAIVSWIQGKLVCELPINIIYETVMRLDEYVNEVRDKNEADYKEGPA